jgi:RNA polymerase sigma-70 factor, ECF subfamily
MAGTPLPQVDVTNDGGMYALVAQARAGDSVALETLARQELPRVERLLRRLLGRRQDMEDLVQTVFFELCRALPGFRGESSFSTFVGGITVRVAQRAMRPTAWWRLRGEMPAHVPTGAADPARATMASEQLRRVHEALERISPKKRVPFLLWALEGMDVESIAETTGASVSATRSRIFYAQKELKAAAAEDPYLRELIGEPDAGS